MDEQGAEVSEKQRLGRVSILLITVGIVGILVAIPSSCWAIEQLEWFQSPDAVTSPPTLPSLPTPFVYTVQAGDTMSGIAARFGSTVDELVQANRLVDFDRLQIGQRLRIPNLAR